MKNVITIILFTIVIFAVNAIDSHAQKLHKTYGYWKVFTHKLGGEKLCYIASIPTKKTGNYNRRGEPFALVTYRPNVADEFSTSSGYPYRTSSKVQVKIDGRQFNLFSENERAWAFDQNHDTKIVNAMRKGNAMEIRGTSKKGTYSLDKYSLYGVTQALEAMQTLCNTNSLLKKTSK